MKRNQISDDPKNLKPIQPSKTRKTGLSHLLHQIRKLTAQGIQRHMTACLQPGRRGGKSEA